MDGEQMETLMETVVVVNGMELEPLEVTVAAMVGGNLKGPEDPMDGEQMKTTMETAIMVVGKNMEELEDLMDGEQMEITMGTTMGTIPVVVGKKTEELEQQAIMMEKAVMVVGEDMEELKDLMDGEQMETTMETMAVVDGEKTLDGQPMQKLAIMM
jgi:hypothetical protein